jgi:hypothetical protein
MFDDPHDLVALRVPADQDRLSEFILNNFGRGFQVRSLPFPFLAAIQLRMLIMWFQ